MGERAGPEVCGAGPHISASRHLSASPEASLSPADSSSRTADAAPRRVRRARIRPLLLDGPVLLVDPERARLGPQVVGAALDGLSLGLEGLHGPPGAFRLELPLVVLVGQVVPGHEPPGKKTRRAPQPRAAPQAIQVARRVETPDFSKG